MKKIFTLFILASLTAMSVDAHGLKITPRYIEHSRNMRKAKAERTINPSTKMASKPLEEYTEIIDDPQYSDIRYRYVFSYDKDLQRVSEAIYESVKEDGVWSSEKFLTMGSYTYGYDIQGRVNMKKVTYDPEPEYGPIDSYYITISYNDAGVASYQKYIKSDSDYYLDETWAYYPNGTLAAHQYDLWGNEYGSDYYAVEYDQNGIVSMFSDSQYRKDLYTGDLNARTVTSMENYSDAWETTKIRSHKYDNTFGALTEYSIAAEYDDTEKYVIAYDEFGRVTSIKCYDEGNGDASDSSPIIPKSVSADTEWSLEWSETYTYANDEVYSVGNSWHDVLGFDGPVVTCVYQDEYSETTSSIIFNRDSSGKITGIDYASDDSEDAGQTFNIDTNGYITSVIDYNYDYSIEYTWEDDMIIKEVTDDMGWIETSIFEQGEGWHKAKTYSGSDDSDYEITEVKKSDNKCVVTYDSYYNGKLDEGYSERFILETQTDDVAFIRPYINKDMDGMIVEEPIIISQAGKVICSAKDIENSSVYTLNDNTALGYIVPNAIEEVDDYYGLDLGIAIYYSVSHQGSNTICSNADGLPIFVLDGDRLVKEYVYYKESYEMNGGGALPTPTAATVPSGLAYDEISYVYNNDGDLQGKSVVSVDSNGTKTEEIEIEYKYIEESGIDEIEIDAKPSAVLNGRTLGFKSNESFSVYTIDGKQIASEVSSLTLPSAGIYIIDINGQTMKMHVK